MPLTEDIRQHKQALIGKYARADNLRGSIQCLTTLAPLAVLWYAAALGAEVSYWLTAAVTLIMSFLLLRVFILMHECGHNSLFREAWLNRAFGFVFGVICGMPGYVWSQHHAYHHATNGNWAKYRGPLSVITADEYAALSEKQRRRYRRERSIAALPLGGFLYLIVNPRLTWLKGSAALVLHLLRGKPAAQFRTPYWTSPRQYWHMFWNNVVLVALWCAMSLAIGPGLFFAVYLMSGALNGAGGIVLFTVQHNFEHSYASGDEGWDYDHAAIHGTSFLVLPRWLNWCSANIAYHHIHHLSASIPNYRLAECQAEYQHLFTGVPRLSLAHLPVALKYILWDTRARRIISVAEAEVRFRPKADTRQLSV